jgi:hypothetical protein
LTGTSTALVAAGAFCEEPPLWIAQINGDLTDCTVSWDWVWEGETPESCPPTFSAEGGFMRVSLPGEACAAGNQTPGVLTLTATVTKDGVDVEMMPLTLTLTDGGCSGASSGALSTVVFQFDGVNYALVEDSVTVPQDTAAEFWVGVRRSNGQPAPPPIWYDVDNPDDLSLIAYHNGNVIEVGGQSYTISGPLQVTSTAAHPSGTLVVRGKSEWVDAAPYALVIN